MSVRLPPPSSNRPEPQPAVLVLYASDAVALGRLSVDLTAGPGMSRRRVTLASDAQIPQSTSADVVRTRQLADRAAIDRALGVLLEQGWVPDEGRRELQRMADNAGLSLVNGCGQGPRRAARRTARERS